MIKFISHKEYHATDVMLLLNRYASKLKINQTMISRWLHHNLVVFEAIIPR